MNTSDDLCLACLLGRILQHYAGWVFKRRLFFNQRIIHWVLFIKQNCWHISFVNKRLKPHFISFSLSYFSLCWELTRYLHAKLTGIAANFYIQVLSKQQLCMKTFFPNKHFAVSGSSSQVTSVFEVHFTEQFPGSTILWDLSCLYHGNLLGVKFIQTTYHAAAFQNSLKWDNKLITHNDSQQNNANYTGAFDKKSRKKHPFCVIQPPVLAKYFIGIHECAGKKVISPDLEVVVLQGAAFFVLWLLDVKLKPQVHKW